MGSCCSCLRHNPRIIVIGLASAGKTTIVHCLNGKKVENTLPTYGFENDLITFEGIQYDFWDLGGQDKCRPSWGPYYKAASGVIFVIDSSDPALFHAVKQEIHKAANDSRLDGVPFLVFANKQDVQGAIPGEKLISTLSLDILMNQRYGDNQLKRMPVLEGLNENNDLQDPSRRCCVFDSCAIHDQGIQIGMKWLADAIMYRIESA